MSVIAHTLAVARKEMRQVRRDVRTLLVLAAMPLFFVWLFGYALNFDIRNVPLAVQDQDGSPDSRSLIAAFTQSGYFRFVDAAWNDRDIERLIDTDRARAVLVVPRGFQRDVRNGREVRVQVIVNGDNANTAATVVGYANATIRGASVRLIAERSGAATPVPRIALEPRVWFNPELKSSLFLIPGLVAYLAMMTGVISTALSIVREKERGTFEQVRMAPIATVSYILGKLLPYLVVSFISAIGVLVVAMLLFGLPMKGSWPLLLASTTLFLVCALAIGLLISTVTETQQAAFQLATLVSVLPTIILSGFIFPISGMPLFIRAITYLVPARYYLVALRSILLKGVGLETVAAQLGALCLLAVLFLAVATVRVRRQVVG
jgi:ABC-2 type transport system permease protein